MVEGSQFAVGEDENLNLFVFFECFFDVFVKVVNFDFAEIEFGGVLAE